MLSFENKAYGIIENSRQSVYGYDQRLEVFGSEGMIKAENPLKNSNRYFNEEGAHLSRHLNFFMDRYAASYQLEMEAFIKALLNQSDMPVTGRDGLRSMIIAEAANRSLKENRPVKIDEI